MTAIVTNYAARTFTTLADEIDNPEKYLRFATPFGDGFGTLEAAGMLDREYFDNYEYGGEFRVSTTIKYSPSPLALVAFKNLSNDFQFVGSFQEFAQKLTEYAKLWQEAIYQLDVYPPEPYLSKYIHDGWGIPDEYMFKPYANWKPKPALEDVIRWASDDTAFERLHAYVNDTGIDSYVEALSEGVPLEDILA